MSPRYAMNGSVSRDGSAPRILMLATYFPKPTNPLMGTWALAPAQALARQGVPITVVSPTSWVPRAATRVPGLSGLRSWSDCPATYDWGGLAAEYPRWLWYAHQGRAHGLSRRDPRPQLEIGWRTLRPALERTLERLQPDVIYAHHSSIGGYLALQLHRSSGIPYVVIEHDHGEIADCRRYPKRRSLYAEVIASAQAVVAVATPMERELTGLFPGAPVHVVHNASDLPDPALTSVPRPDALGPGPVVFSAAHLYRRKGMPVLVDAFSRIASSHPGAVLRIAGEGEDRAEIEAVIARTGMADRVRLLGRASHDQVLQEMAWADVFALIGWDEPHAIAHMEAMASGTPVLCADDGGIMDIFEDGVHGRAVPPRDPGAAAEALDELLADDIARKRMGQAGRSLVERRHTWEAYAQDLLGVLASATTPALESVA